MRCGLFGKLPAKRDFISVSTPRAFLRLWEPWVDAGLATSRTQIGAAEWAEVFGSAPIWRFWLGADLCGATVLGAWMPSVDALGRYFPLTLIGLPDGDKGLVSPDLDPCHDWFERAEDFLLATLDPEARFDAIVASLDELAKPNAESHDDGLVRDDFFTIIGDCAGHPLARIFAAPAVTNGDYPLSSASFWWTLGGGHYPPLAWRQENMPEAMLFAAMLTSRFAGRSEETLQTG